MEIMIIGGALVALMIYVSTKIKKSAADAYEPETIETDEFILVKPAGFLNPIKEDSEYAFEAHTRDFGDGEAEKIYRARAVLRIGGEHDASPDDRAGGPAFETVTAEETSAEPGGGESVTLAGERIEDGVEIEGRRKIVRKNGRIYDLKVEYIKDLRADYEAAVRQLFESFRVK